jgi:hypothetical protein
LKSSASRQKGNNPERIKRERGERGTREKKRLSINPFLIFHTEPIGAKFSKRDATFVFFKLLTTTDLIEVPLTVSFFEKLTNFTVVPSPIKLARLHMFAHDVFSESKCF